MGSPVAMGLSVLGMGANAAGAMKSAQAEQDALNYQADTAAQNAAIADQRAKLALQIGQKDEAAVRMKTAQVASAQKAAFAANGVVVNDGSAAETQAGSLFTGEKDALTVRDNAAREAWAAKVQSTNYTNQSNYTRDAAGKVNPRQAGILSLLGGATSFASRFYPGN